MPKNTRETHEKSYPEVNLIPMENVQFNAETFSATNKNTKKVFIFPGNSSHHTSKHTLRSIKYGSGLAQVATLLGQQGHATLSLPTTSMEQWATSASQKKTVQNALCDLYKAAGAGFDVVLPIRDKQADKTYFSGMLNLDLAGPNKEPKFWGGIQMKSNLPLANYYMARLNELQQFLKFSQTQKETVIARIIENPKDETYPLIQAYIEGYRMPANTHDFPVTSDMIQIVVTISPSQKFQQEMNMILQELRHKKDELNLHIFGRTASQSANTIYKLLTHATTTYFNSPQESEDKQIFSDACQQMILSDEYKDLQHHRGIKLILGNLCAALGYFFNSPWWTEQGEAFLQSETKSIQIINKFKDIQVQLTSMASTNDVNNIVPCK